MIPFFLRFRLWFTLSAKITPLLPVLVSVWFSGSFSPYFL